MVGTAQPSQAARDAARYRWVLCGSMTLALAVFAVGSAFQALLLQLDSGPVPAWQRLVANAAGIAVIVGGAWLAPIPRLSWRARAIVMVALCLAGVLIRAAGQWVLGVTPAAAGLVVVSWDLVPASVTTIFSIALSFALAEYQDRLTAHARARTRQALVAAGALEALRAEELRVRREVAEGLHGTLQQQLVMLSTCLRRSADSLSLDSPREAAIARELAWAYDELDRLRDHDVRDMSRLLYPSGIDVGLVQASRILIRHVPPGVEIAARIGDAVVAADDPADGGIPLELRLLAIRVLEEAITNALRHGHAERLDIVIDVDTARALHIVIDDDGTGADPDGTPNGLRLLGDRLRERGGALALTGGPLGGARLIARLPLSA